MPFLYFLYCQQRQGRGYINNENQSETLMAEPRPNSRPGLILLCGKCDFRSGPRSTFKSALKQGYSYKVRSAVAPTAFRFRERERRRKGWDNGLPA